ncbi:Pycsar system effector family protein [Streptomyces cinnamoneus]|uniref:Pycsar system effector family protein n=1 Tax=Streptomyces cinnamoneus TaxID=53446 RepID=UPI0034165D80
MTPPVPPTTPPTTDEQLARAQAYVATEIGRADNKATALVTALGILLSVIVAVAVAPGRSLPVLPAVLIACAAMGFVTAMVASLLAIRPTLGSSVPPAGTYLHWAACAGPEEVLEDLATDRRAERLLRRSQIARHKFRLLRLAVDLTAIAVFVLATGLFAALIE